LVPVHRQDRLLTVERHAEHLGVLRRGVDVEDVHRLQRCRVGLDLPLVLDASRIGVLLGRDGRRDGRPLLPLAKAAELRIEREHVGERRRARAGQAVDVDRSAHGEVVDLGVLGVPRLDLEAVDEPAEEVGDRGLGSLLAQVTVLGEAGELALETVAEVAGPEVGETGRLDGLAEQLLGTRVLRAHRVSWG
jgi:hypothetical protein